MLEQVTVLYPPARWEERQRGRLAAHVAAEFPSIFVRFERDASGAADLAASQWDQRDFDVWSFDCRIDELAAQTPYTLTLADDREGKSDFPLEVLNRCQRLIDRRNRHSHGHLFDRVLRKHHALHDLAKPLVRADYNHALDVWQWVLRLEPEASLPVQLAALFHDVERLASEADARVEHLAADYQEFKDAHARRGAEMTREVLAQAGVAEPVRTRVADLIAVHEHTGTDPEITLLNDADALSFFSLNSPGYADYFGAEQTRKKVAYTLARMSERARAKLGMVHLRTDVREMVGGRRTNRTNGTNGAT